MSPSRQTPLLLLETIEAPPQLEDQKGPDMITKIRRIALVLATSSGLIAATTLVAQAGVDAQHCEARLPR